MIHFLVAGCLFPFSHSSSSDHCFDSLDSFPRRTPSSCGGGSVTFSLCYLVFVLRSKFYLCCRIYSFAARYDHYEIASNVSTVYVVFAEKLVEEISWIAHCRFYTTLPTTPPITPTSLFPYIRPRRRTTSLQSDAEMRNALKSSLSNRICRTPAGISSLALRCERSPVDAVSAIDEEKVRGDFR